MIGSGLPGSAARSLRRADRRIGHALRPNERCVLLDARTAMEYAAMMPVQRALQRDPRILVYATSSERPVEIDRIYRDRDDRLRLIHPRRLWRMRFDVYLAADFVWAALPRGTCRVQMFHGVSAKWSRMYDRPTGSMRHWDRLLFINRRRRDNYIRAGAVDADSPAVRLVGMPKTDCLVDGSIRRDSVLTQHGCDPARPVVLYAPTWTPYSSLNVIGEALVHALMATGATVIVKLHENSRDARGANSGGIDWVARLTSVLAGRGHLVASADASPFMVAADVLITDHSSVGFEYLLRDRPVVRIELPELIRRADIAPEYVDLLAAASISTRGVADTAAAVRDALADPGVGSAVRRQVAAELFHAPGDATRNVVRELCATMDIEFAPALSVTSDVSSSARTARASSAQYSARVRLTENRFS
jgi:hypothetical protein